MNKVFLLIGGNMGDRLQNLHQAIALLSATCGPVIQQSAVYETAAWGKTDQAAFLNQALLLTTALTPQELITTILSVEEKMGRLRMEKNGPRVIDIDIIFYNDLVIHEPHLTIPHPQLQNRRFVLIPLVEIAPAYVHPIFNKTVTALLEECKDDLEVKLITTHT
ncbi:2-amino-4-hydroxy-6-hydroxymethyldihydropteridine diphosphokinase [Niastella yeongjuensis]|uniref:2-amino-4-hydroxy-6-hydroxymethyldihydropteridine pyrophosphokinase n=1 Tax=Niastella yeongjuensis TaxID=354355 RepID=A0A1V9F8J9_9BACT|nr:2-amino-4-hydroxy-6-hydroxymethyldihydropteridine diphosphokinase [Niastella yeongjuensis]OQP54694.1 2-amino-4-hydroxy-6-hydroxymethyldihydropteridine diphosphokinase [Niastella yeongjuensis]